MKQTKTAFFCQSCGYQSGKWLGKCPACNEWNQFAEEKISSDEKGALTPFGTPPLSIHDIPIEETERIKTGVEEIDRVLGGGIVHGSVVLVGGEPGIGKSTLLLQVLQKLAAQGSKVLYVSGEESAKQIRLRGQRVSALSRNLLVLTEISIEKITTHLKDVQPSVLVVDSIQTTYSDTLSSAPGSVGQVREGAQQFVLLAKKTGIPVFLVGHVTKDGAIAGPKILEHMVDTVLYFEGDSGHPYRIIRAIKNRYGPTNEVGVFEMAHDGLREVANPSSFFLTERTDETVGSVVVPTMEGTRPILIEIQGLVGTSGFGAPRRTTMGVDHNRISLLVAVMDKVWKEGIGNHDIFINVTGGIKIDEPAADLGIVSAIISSFMNRPIDQKTIVFGEVGLTGEIRRVSQIQERVKEAARMGFNRCLMPKAQADNLSSLTPKMALFPINSLKEMLEYLF
ncbi:MAG: DNA repair protein RadA [Syntrophobacterales bacterium]|jgi:DNA repair protein RadA/Sms|nr:DNA repair protein RadA [Syntrophobacterales bacterium]